MNWEYDSITPAERLKRIEDRRFDNDRRAGKDRRYQRTYPWWIAFIAALLLIYGLTDAITRLGDRVEFKVTHSCGI